MSNDIQNTQSPSDLIRQQDYKAIEEAVMETARGRWFLAEYARQNRTADTNMLLKAIHKLEENLNQPNLHSAQIPTELDKIVYIISGIAQAIQSSNSQIKTTGTDHISDALEAFATQTKQINTDILNAAEAIEEAIWLLRQQGLDSEICDRLDSHASDIYTACSQHQLSANPLKIAANLVRNIQTHLQNIASDHQKSGEPSKR